MENTEADKSGEEEDLRLDSFLEKTIPQCRAEVVRYGFPILSRPERIAEDQFETAH